MYDCKGDSCSFKKLWSDSMLGFWQCSCESVPLRPRTLWNGSPSRVQGWLASWRIFPIQKDFSDGIGIAMKKTWCHEVLCGSSHKGHVQTARFTMTWRNDAWWVDWVRSCFFPCLFHVLSKNGRRMCFWLLLICWLGVLSWLGATTGSFDQISKYRCSERKFALRQHLEFFLPPDLYHMTVEKAKGDEVKHFSYINSRTFAAESFFLYFQKYFWKSTPLPILSCFRWSLLWKVPTPKWWWNGRWMSSFTSDFHDV